MASDAATHYIRAGAVGSNNGSSWANAWTDLNQATYTRGDTYYIAGGTYSGATFSTGASGTTAITIKAAITSDHGAAADWSDDYQGQAVVAGECTISSPYWVFDGQTRSGWKTGYLLKFWNDTNIRGATFHMNSGANNCTFRYVECMGTNNKLDPTHEPDGVESDGDNCFSGGAVINGFTVQYCYLHDTGNTQIQMNQGNGQQDNFLVEYTYLARNHMIHYAGGAVNSHNNHDQAFAVTPANMIVRYCIFEDIMDSGMISWTSALNMTGTGLWQVYGNIFWWTDAFQHNAEAFCSTGVLNLNTDPKPAVNFYNNTIYGITNYVSQVHAMNAGVEHGSPANINNNIWYNCQLASFFIADYNSFYRTDTVGNGGHDYLTGTLPSIFTDPANGDFSLTGKFAGTTNGLARSSPYDKDMTGATRGADGTTQWDRGALEFGVTDPAISSQPVSTNVFAGQNAIFRVTATGTSPFSYQWKFNGTNVPGATTSAYTHSNSQLNESGLLALCVVTNTLGSVNSASATLTVSPDPYLSTLPQATSVYEGQSATFTATVVGSTAGNYQWYFGGSAVAGATTSSFTHANSALGENGTQVYVACTNTVSYTNSPAVTLTVNANGSATDFYVAKTGSDANDGSVGNPWLTVQHASDTVQAGSVVHVAAGIYNQHVTTANAGTANNPITYIASANVTNLGFSLSKDYNIVQGFTVNGVTDFISPFTVSARYCQVVSNTIINNVLATSTTEINITATAFGCTILGNNWINNTGYTDNDHVVFNIRGTNHLITLNNIGPVKDADAFRAWGVSNVVRSNFIHDITYTPGTTAHADTVQTWGDVGPFYVMQNFVFENNIVSNSVGSMFMSSDDGFTSNHDIDVRNNIFVKVAQQFNIGVANFRIYNNTLWSIDTDNEVAFIIYGVAGGAPNYGYGNNCKLKNNIVIGPGGLTDANGIVEIFSDWNNSWYASAAAVGVTGFEIDYNYTAYNPAAGYLAIPNHSEAHGINGGNPFLTTPGTNFALQASSPLIDSGATIASVPTDMDGVSRPQGAGYDIGAFEFEGSGVGPGISTQPASLTNLVGASAAFSVAATGSAPLTYQWFFNGTGVGSNSSGYTRANISLADSNGAVKVIITNVYGSITSSVATLTVTNGVSPTISAQPASLTNLVGSTANFSVTAAGNSPLAYQWFFNGSGVGANSSSYSRANISLADSNKTVQVVITNLYGSVTSSVATLTVTNGVVAITVNPLSQTNGTTSNMVFTVTATGNPTLGYRWYFNGVLVAGATTTSYTRTNLALSDSGKTVFSIVTNAYASASSSVATLSVTNSPIAPVINVSPQNTTVAVGSNATFTVTASGTPSVAYQWKSNGTNIPSATTSSYTLANCQLVNSGSTFLVVVTNIAGSATSSSATLTVTNVPTPPVTAHVFIVATNGLDSNPGTNVSAPWLTLKHALSQVDYGDTINMRAGTYREHIYLPTQPTNGSLNNLLTIQGYNGERPVISGLTNISSTWTEVAAPIIKTATYGATSTSNTIVDDVILGTTNFNVWSTTYAGRPQEAFYVSNAGPNEVRIPLQQLGWSGTNYDWVWYGSPGAWNNGDKRPSAIFTNWARFDWAFFWCASNSTLYVQCASGYYPTNANVQIEVSATEPFYLGWDNVYINGLTFLGCQSSDTHIVFPGVALHTNCYFMNSTVDSMDLNGLSVLAGCTVSNSIIKNCGVVGLNVGGWVTDRNNQIISNNWRGMPTSFGAGGEKWITTVTGQIPDFGGSIVSGNQYVGNGGFGLWFDTCWSNTTRMVVSENYLAFNGRRLVEFTNIHGGGIQLEISGNTLATIDLYNNIAISNNLAGIYLRGARGARLQFNTIIAGLGASCYVNLAYGTDKVPTGNVFKNNVLEQLDPSQPAVQLQTGFTSSGTFYDLRPINTLDHNCYNIDTYFASVAPDDPNNGLILNLTFSTVTNSVAPYWETTSFVADPKLHGYSHAPNDGSPVINRGRPVFSVPYDYLGLTRSLAPSMGALEGNGPKRLRL